MHTGGDNDSVPNQRRALFSLVSGESGSLPPMRVLLVEDDLRLAEGIRSGLATAGISADIAEGGEEGLAAAIATSYDAIVLDDSLGYWLSTVFFSPPNTVCTASGVATTTERNRFSAWGSSGRSS